MKLLRFGPKGQEKPGCLDADGTIRDLSGVAGDFAGAGVSIEVLAALADVDLSALPAVPADVRIGSCLGDVPNFHCVGLNYLRHAKESGMAVPEEPVLFSKATSCLSGPNDPIVLPRDIQKGDWEVELGIVIGKPTSYVDEADALSHVAGFCLINDVSERHFQLERSGTWYKGKSFPTFGPTGPWLVTPDEIADVQKLDMWLKVNGKTMQSSNTSDMIFSAANIVAFMSTVMELRTGDVIATGTPEGVGMGQNPQQWLQPGDVVELGIEGLGDQRQDVVAWGG